jgi:hypothetical protein
MNTDKEDMDDFQNDSSSLTASEQDSAATDSGIDADEEERMMILAQADQVKGMQLLLSDTGEFTSEPEIKAYALSEGPRDPERMYELYYKGIQKMLLRYLPKGKARTWIYEEKNTYLTRGHRIQDNGIRGADSRMGYPEDAETVFNIIINWVTTSRNSVDLYMTLRDLNIRSGYGTPVNG